MADFVTVAKVGEIPEGKGRRFTVGAREIAVFHIGGRYYALDDRCPHMGASLAVGEVREDRVICVRHMWAFRLADGACPDAPALKAETYEVRVENDEIRVRVPASG
ncbi:MAG TPA: Rieske 2Fe-2S domain-containing protein [Thermoguttaceae bacterium]|nr:Rieske 2Fe-2S domain-containing protein [Thermoguttaceae bacterium]